MLRYPTIVSGIHQWTIKIEEGPKCIWLGVVLRNKPLDSNGFLGNQEVGWVYGCKGAAIHAAKAAELSSTQRFVQGSEVTLTLDLNPDEEGNGTLSVSVDNEGPIAIFSGMRHECLVDQGRGFVPALNLRAPGRARLLDIRKISA